MCDKRQPSELCYEFTVGRRITCGDALMIDPKTGKIVPWELKETAQLQGYARRDYDEGETLIINIYS